MPKMGVFFLFRATGLGLETNGRRRQGARTPAQQKTHPFSGMGSYPWVYKLLYMAAN